MRKHKFMGRAGCEASMQEKQKKGITWRFPHKLTRDNFLIVVLVGVLLLVIVWPVEDKDGKEKTQSEQWDIDADRMNIRSNTGETEAEVLEAALSGNPVSYAAFLAQALEELLATMEGVGKVRVMVTLEGSGISVVEKDQRTERTGTDETDSAGGSRKTSDTSFEEETVFDSSRSSSGSPFVRQILAPQVEGVVVSAQGGGDAKVVRNITEAIQALFGIEAHKIKIVKMISQ